MKFLLYCGVILFGLSSSAIAASEKTDEILFLDFLGILADFAKILCDPENIPNAQKNVASIISKIVHVAHTVIRTPLSPEKKELLARIVMGYSKMIQQKIRDKQR